MAAGIYKDGVAIIVVYQAVNTATGKTITMDIYDEGYLLDAVKSVAAMTEVVGTGRYYATFTPDAEGEWIAVMKNTTDSNGEIVQAFAVAGHDLDSVGDTVAAIDTLIKAAGAGDLAAMKTILDTESGVKAAVVALNDFDPATDPVATVTALTGHTAQTGDSYPIVSHVTYGLDAIKTLIDSITTGGPTQAQMDTAHALLATVAKQDVIDGYHDVPIEDAVTDAQMRDVVGKKTDTVAGTSIVSISKQVKAKTDNIPAAPATEGKQDTIDTVVDGIQTDLSNATDGLGAIKDGVDGLGSPAMHG